MSSSRFTAIVTPQGFAQKCRCSGDLRYRGVPRLLVQSTPTGISAIALPVRIVSHLAWVGDRAERQISLNALLPDASLPRKFDGFGSRFMSEPCNLPHALIRHGKNRQACSDSRQN